MLGRFVPDHLDFLNDDSPLPLDLGTLEQGVAVHVGENFRDTRKMIRRGRRVVAGTLLGGVGIEVATDTFDFLADPACTSFLSSLEEQMLQKVGDPSYPSGLMASANSGPETDCHGLRGGHRAGGDPKAVTKCRDA